MQVILLLCLTDDEIKRRVVQKRIVPGLDGVIEPEVLIEQVALVVRIERAVRETLNLERLLLSLAAPTVFWILIQQTLFPNPNAEIAVEMLSWQTLVSCQAEMLNWLKHAQNLDKAHEAGMLSRQMFLLSRTMVVGILPKERLPVEGIEGQKLRSARFRALLRRSSMES